MEQEQFPDLILPHNDVEEDSQSVRQDNDDHVNDEAAAIDMTDEQILFSLEDTLLTHILNKNPSEHGAATARNEDFNLQLLREGIANL